MVRRPRTSGDITTFVWALYFSAGLLGAAITGPMADAGLIKEMFWIAIPMAAQVVIPILFKCFPERRLAPSERGFQRHVYEKNKQYFVAAFAMAIGSVGLMFINLFDSGWQVNLAYCLLVSVFLCSMAW